LILLAAIAGAGGVATLVLLVVALRTAIARWRAPELPAAASFEARVTALVPVRDEATNIDACLASLLAQRGPLSIRVVDDASRDDTAARVAAIARTHRQVMLLVAPPPPDGRSGKTNALAYGATGVTDDWLLAVDADVRLAPDAVARALAAAEGETLDAVSLAARQRVATLGEALLTPLVFGWLDARLGDWRAAARGAGPPVANGQFVLVRRSALAAIGGYAALAGCTLDDVALARALAAAGRRLGFWRARAAVSTRMYPGLGATFRGWRRNLALILGDSRASTVPPVALAVAPLATALAAATAGKPAAAIALWGLGATASALARAGTGSAALFGLLYPFDAIGLAGCLVAARRDRASGAAVLWRGRAVDQSGSGAA